MKLNRFNIRIVIYALLISFTGFMAFRSVFEEHLFVTYFSWFFAWILLLFGLIRLINRTNRKLKTFLESLQYLDTLSLAEDGDETFKELNLSFNRIIENIKSARKDKEAQGIYFRNTVEHVNIGLISYNSDGKIKMINKAARKILQISSILHIEKLDEIKDGFCNELLELKPNENRVYSLIIKNELKRIALKKAQLKVLDEELNIISLQDIRVELEEEELETWQKLIRILRHEIMNSAAPINSLSNSLLGISEKLNPVMDTEQAEMMREGLEAISIRSKGMMNFVEAYRNLTNIPQPVFKEFQLKDLFEEVKKLYSPTLKERKIQLLINSPENQVIIADYDLLSQVIINLVKNAFQAIENKKGEIILYSKMLEDGSIRIKVIDNGKGIPEEELEKIFMPFYTTAEEGSGIGLSLARQIIRLHKGTIRVSSEPGKTVLEIRI